MIEPRCPVILFALDREGAPFRRTFSQQERIRQAPCRAWQCRRTSEATYLLMEIGIGTAKTQKALDWLQAQWRQAQPPFMVMAGFAGSLTSELSVGDVFFAREIIDLQGNCWPATWPGDGSGSNRYAGRLITTPRMIGDPAEKRRLQEKYAAQAVDMEAATVAKFCQGFGITFGCVRAISDDVDTRLSPHLVSLLANGQVSIPRLLSTLALHPTVLGSLLKLAKDTRLASLALAGALTKLLGSLGCVGK